MNELFSIFLNNLLPIFFLAGAGYLLSKWQNAEPRTLSQVVFYIFSPCLVFQLMTSSQLEANDLTRMVSFAVIVVALLGGLTWIAGRLMRLEHRLLMAVLLVVMFMNAGNFGLSVNFFVFGEEGLAHASLYFVTTGILTYTVGVIIASMGSSGLREAVVGLYKIPIVYAVILGLVFMRFDWQPPVPISRGVQLCADAAIPAMLVLLGMQMHQAEISRYWRAMFLAGGMRLFVSPVLALVLAPWFGLQGPALQAGVLESAMPTAVLTTILATQYDLEPPFVTAAVFISTLLCPITLTPLIAYLVG